MGSKPLRPTLPEFIELTLEALESRQKRLDWDWVICFYIQRWEAMNREGFKKARHPLLHGHFAWYHWHEICDRVLRRAEDYLQGTKEELLVPANHEGRRMFSGELCFALLYPECQAEFETLAKELEDHGLDLYANA